MNDDLEYVGFWARLVASILDNVWMGIVMYSLLWLVVGSAAFEVEADHGLAGILILYVLPIVVVIAFWKIKAATPGKMLLSMKIVDAKTNGPVSTPRLVLRYFGYLISAIPVGLGFIWVAFDKKKQGFHDKIAGTVIVKI